MKTIIKIFQAVSKKRLWYKIKAETKLKPEVNSSIARRKIWAPTQRWRQKTFLRLLVTFFLIFSISNKINAQDFESTLMSVEGYLKELKNFELEGGELFCENKEGEKDIEYHNCREFMLLQEQGCYGFSTHAIGLAIRYESTCDEIKAVRQARVAAKNFFKLDAKDWWQSLPAEIIPLPGGLYEDEILAREEYKLKNVFAGKLLRDLKFDNILGSNREVELVLSTTKEECGEIRDVLHFSPVLLADFDNDAIAELLIKGYRTHDSESCLLGSGNNLGGEFFVLLKKTSSTEKITILPLKEFQISFMVKAFRP